MFFQHNRLTQREFRVVEHSQTHDLKFLDSNNDFKLIYNNNELTVKYYKYLVDLLVNTQQYLS